MRLVTIDLTKNPDIAALVADMEPGAKVYGCFSLKSRDDQTLTLRISEMAESPDQLPKPGEYADDDAEDEQAEPTEDGGEETEMEAEKPGKSLAKKLTAEANPRY